MAPTAKGYTVAAVAAVVLIVFLIGGCSSFTTPDAGTVVVIRNGGPFDNRDIRQIVSEGSGKTWRGLFSNEHPYPAASQQRIYKFDEADDADAPPIEVPTRDGVRVRLTGTFYVNTAFDGSKQGDKLLRDFDTAFGTRNFGSPNSDSGKKPWEDGGWSVFLDAVVKPVIDSNMREVIATFDCKQLVSSCALVQRGGKVDAGQVKDEKNASNIQQIQNQMNASLAREIPAKLGEPYFANIRFSLGLVELPGVQGAIDRAQSAFANVSEAQARVEQANQDKKANQAKQEGYNACKSCARQDELRQLPRGLTTLVFGGNSPVAIGGK